MSLMESVVDNLTALSAKFRLALFVVRLLLELPASSRLAKPAGGDNMLPFNAVAALVVLPSL